MNPSRPLVLALVLGVPGSALAAKVEPTDAKVEDFYRFEVRDQPREGLKGIADVKEAVPGLGVASPAAILVGTTDFFVERAEVEVRAWAGDRLASQVCTTTDARAVQPGRLAPALCALGIEKLGLDAASGRELVAAARKDAVALTRNLSEELLRGATTDEERDALVAIAAVARMTELVVEGHTPHAAVAAWARDRQPVRPKWTCAKGDGKRECALGPDEALTFAAEPAASVLYTASAMAGCVPEGTIRIEKGEWKLEEPSSVWDIEDCLKTNLDQANLPGGAPEAGALVGKAGDLEESARAAGVAYVDLKNAFASIGIRGRGAPPSVEQVTTAWATAVAGSAGLVGEILDLVDEPDTDKASEIARWVEKVAATVADGEYLGTLQALTEAPFIGDKVPDELRNGYATLGKAAGLATDLAAAESAAEAESSIERFAAPAGGYKAKRRGPKPVYATINGYLGAGAGGEITPQAATRNTTGTRGAAWPTLQLGPEFGFRLSPQSKHPSALGFQLGLLDLGAIAVWRMGVDEEQDELPDLDVRNVFAPSGNLMWGLPGAPFSLGLMVGVNPALREIDKDGQRIEATSGRIGGVLAVDMPVLH